MLKRDVVEHVLEESDTIERAEPSFTFHLVRCCTISRSSSWGCDRPWSPVSPVPRTLGGKTSRGPSRASNTYDGSWNVAVVKSAEVEFQPLRWSFDGQTLSSRSRRARKAPSRRARVTKWQSTGTAIRHQRYRIHQYPSRAQTFVPL